VIRHDPARSGMTRCGPVRRIVHVERPFCHGFRATPAEKWGVDRTGDTNRRDYNEGDIPR
jgi:hypothetical protein